VKRGGTREKLAATLDCNSPLLISSIAPDRVAPGDGRKADLPTHQARNVHMIMAQLIENKKAIERHTTSWFQAFTHIFN
jgi:hypothetical protein